MRNTDQSGLSLVEILVTLTVISLLISVAAPNLQVMMEKNQAQSLSSEFVSSLYRTRSEAAKRGFNVTLCASNTAQTSCDNSAADFSKGWIIFTDYDDDDALDAPTNLFDVSGDGVKDTPEEILHVSDTLPGTFKIKLTTNSTALKNRLTYRSNGLADIGNLMGVSYRISKDGTSATQKSKVYLAKTGRIRSCTGADGEC